MRSLRMPKVGIEPTLPKEHDFESCASASSATPALFILLYFPQVFDSITKEWSGVKIRL